jgi:riboflavin transporter FmnP
MLQVSIKKWVLAACLAAISYLLMFLSFAVIPIVPYMKIDFSDLAVLIGFFVLGTSGGIGVAAIRSVLYFVITGVSLDNFIGVATSFIASLAFCLPLYFLLKNKQTLQIKNYALAIVVATLILTVVLSLANWLVITPVYIAVLGLNLGLPVAKLVLYGVIPFNLIKGVLVGSAFALVFSKLHGWLTIKATDFSN